MMSHRWDSSCRQLSKSTLLSISSVITWLKTFIVPFSAEIHRPQTRYHCSATQTAKHWDTHTHITPLASPFAPTPRPATTVYYTQSFHIHVNCSAWFTSFYWPAPPRGQVHCQSGWHKVFHCTSQQTETWWVSTLVVKVTLDGWVVVVVVVVGRGGMAVNAEENIAGSSFPSSQRWSCRELLYPEKRGWLIIWRKRFSF